MPINARNCESKLSVEARSRCRGVRPAVALVVLVAAVATQPTRAALFQHFDASAPDSFVNQGGTNVWLDRSGNGLHAVDDSSGSGSVTLSTDASIFPTGHSSLRFQGSNSNNYGRLRLMTAGLSSVVLDQSGPGAMGFSVFVVAREDTPSPANTWNDLIGNTTDVGDGAFLMRFAEDNGKFQAAVGGKTVQNNFSGQSNYGSGETSVYAFQYDPGNSAGEITLASSHNDYLQVFNLSDSVTDRDFSNNDPLTLGKAFDNISRLFVGHVGEVKIFDAALPASLFQNEVESLASKWTASPDGRLDLIVDRLTGGVTLHSPGSIDVPLVGLSLKSQSGSLDPSDWRSVAETAGDSWLELKAEATELAEATLGTTVISPGETIDLGAVLSLDGSPDLVATYADPVSLATRDVLVRYVNSPPADLLPGDYNDDGRVDSADYTAWRDAEGQDLSLANEVVSLGRVTQEDYDVWSARFGEGTTNSASQVPESRASLVAGLAIGLAGVFVRRGQGALLGTATLALALFSLATPAVAQDATVGVYYYPWWDTHSWDETLRARMLPEDHRPTAGYSRSSDADVIEEHINQSHRGNISLWASSWWGPGSVEDTVLQTNILTHPRAGELKHAVHYESTGRFGSFSSPDFSVLETDLLYLAENVFDDPNYYRIDDRPVVFMYVSRAYFDNPSAQQALASARQAVLDDYGYDPYIVGDEIFSSSFNASRASHFDAVTTFDVYAMSGLSSGDVDAADIQRAANKYAAAENAGVTVIPGVTPGYNDTAVRSGNRPTGRYYTGDTIADAGDVFVDLIEQAALPHVDDAANRLLLVNSFNEWHEDTQIEASVVTAPSSTDDSPSGDQFTQGVTYEGYGTKYLDLLRTHTTPGAPLLIDGDADFDGDLDTDDLTAFAAAWGSENLVDGVRVGGYASRIARPDFNYDGVVDFDDWFVMRSAHPSVSNTTLAALLKAPEPGSLVSCGIALLLASWRRSPRHQWGPLRPDRGEQLEC